MNELSPSQQNRPSPVTKSPVTGDILRRCIADAMQAAIRDMDADSRQQWMLDVAIGSDRSLSTVERAVSGRGLIDTESVFAIAGFLGKRLLNPLLALIGYRAVRPDEMGATAAEELADLRTFRTQVRGLVSDLDKRGRG